MIYFKDENNKVYSYENDCDDCYIKEGLISITKEEADELCKPALLTLANLKIAKKEEFRAICGNKIIAPFTSKAPGYPANFRCDYDDQKRIINAVRHKGGEVWFNESFEWLSEAQINILDLDMVSHINAITRKYASYRKEIDDCVLTEEVEAIVWS